MANNGGGPNSKTPNGQSLRGSGNGGLSSKGKQFWKSIKWDEWWHEFTTELRTDGVYKYPTVWSFAKAKGNTAKEAQLIYYAIGPQPDLPPGKRQPLPYLGDWQKRRREGFWDGEDKVKAVDALIDERKDALAVAKASSRITLRFIEKIAMASEKIDEYFAGMPLSMAEGIDDKSNFRRLNRWIKAQRDLFAILKEAKELFLLENGIPADAKELNSFLSMAVFSLGANREGQPQLNAAVVSANGNGNGHQNGQNGDSPTLKKMMSMVMNKAAAFNLPLPTLDEEEDKAPVIKSEEV